MCVFLKTEVRPLHNSKDTERFTEFSFICVPSYPVTLFRSKELVSLLGSFVEVTQQFHVYFIRQN